MAWSNQKWTVTVTDFFPGPFGRQCRAVALVEGVSIKRARKLERRHACRGVKLFGGDCVSYDNWGARGGRDLIAYRSVLIRPSHRERRYG